MEIIDNKILLIVEREDVGFFTYRKSHQEINSPTHRWPFFIKFINERCRSWRSHGKDVEVEVEK